MNENSEITHPKWAEALKDFSGTIYLMIPYPVPKIKVWIIASLKGGCSANAGGNRGTVQTFNKPSYTAGNCLATHDHGE
jgi:hypothetical protein